MNTLLTELDTQIKKTSESTYLAITYDSTNEYCWIIVNNNFPDLGSLSGLPWVSDEYYQNIMSLEDFFNDTSSKTSSPLGFLTFTYISVENPLFLS